METELGKTSEGQERLGRAKDRLDIRVAEIGQAEIDKESGEQGNNQEPQQEDINENSNDPDGAGGVEPMVQGSPMPSTPREGPAAEHFDLSPRSFFKRRAEDDDVEDDSQDKRPRPRSPTVSYRTDADSNIMNDGGLDGLGKIDRKILSAAILDVDITEVHSPERVARIAKKFGLVAGSSMDLTNGWDFNREDHTRQAWAKFVMKLHIS